MCPVNMAQKLAKEKKKIQTPACTSRKIPRVGTVDAQLFAGIKMSSAARVTTPTATKGSSRKDRPARYWVVKRLSRRRGRACIIQAERVE